MVASFSGILRSSLTVLSAICVAVSVSSACGTGPDRQRILGMIEVDEEYSVVMELPDSVTANETFTLRLMTYSRRPCMEPNGTRVEGEGLQAEVIPYDYVLTDLPPNTGCIDRRSIWWHEAQLRFEESGTAMVTVRGYSNIRKDTIQVQREVVVQR